MKKWKDEMSKEDVYKKEISNKSMSKDSHPPKNVKITCMCNIDQFIARVDQRTKHSSGLAIQHNVFNTIIPETTYENTYFTKPENIVSYHSHYYHQAAQETKEKRRPNNQEFRQKQEKQDQVKSFLKNQLDIYKTEKKHGMFSIVRGETVIIDPDPKEMAKFRHTQMFGAFPHVLFPNLE